MTATPREIIQRNLERRDPPRPGLTFDGDRWTDMAAAGLGPPAGHVERRWTEGQVEYYNDVWGNLWARMVGKSTHGEIHRPAITDWSELPALRPPDFSRPECYAAMRERFASAGDKYRLAFIGGWIFNDARYLRRLENYLEDMAAEPEMLDRLNAIVVKVYEDKIRGAAAAGADGIFYCEDLGTQIGLLFSPAMFRRFFKAEYARLVGLAHSLGLKVFLHSCGCNRDLLADLIDVGIDCFQFDQPMVYDLPALSEQLRAARRALWAPVDIQKVLPTGRREYIEAETVRLIHLFRGGLILKNYGDLPGIGVKPEWDNWFYQTALREAGLAQ